MIQLELQKDLLKLFLKAIKRTQRQYELGIPGKKDSGLKRTIYVDDSKTWYSTKTRTKAYVDLHNCEGYSDKILGPEYSLIENNIEIFIDSLPDEFVYFDLGPGLAKKSKLILEGALKAGKTPLYTAIDISPDMLEVTQNTLKDLDLETKLFVGDFANAEHIDLINKQIPVLPKFVYLGTTLSNYSTPWMLKYLSSSFSYKDKFYLSMQEKPLDVSSVVKQYESILDIFVFDWGVRILGFNSDERYIRFNHNTNAIESYIDVDVIPLLLKDSGLVKGDRLVFFTSRKPTRGYFKEQIDNLFSGSYIFENEMMSFVGGLK